jgi:SAM-dependent methyltransferase
MMGCVSGIGIRRSGTTVSRGGPEEVLSLIFLAAIARPAFASEQPPAQIEQSSQIRVRVYNYAKVPRKTLFAGSEEARRVLKATNVEEVKGSETDPKLPAGGVDLVLMVDVYHELAYPFEVMTKVRDALKPGGRVVFVEYRKEDPQIPIKEVHKMCVDQLKKEMKVIGLVHLRTVESLPWQHIVIFEKPKISFLVSNE